MESEPCGIRKPKHTSEPKRLRKPRVGKWTTEQKKTILHK